MIDHVRLHFEARPSACILSTRDARGTHEADATGEVDWWDRTRAENITITITIIYPEQGKCS